MTMTNTEATGSRKKYLVPVVVLMLCAVSLAGAGYAYSSNITGDDDVETAYYNVTYGENTGLKLKGKLAFDNETSYDKTGSTIKEVKIYKLSEDSDYNTLTFVVSMGKADDVKNTKAFTIDEIDVTVEGLDNFTYSASAKVKDSGYEVSVKVNAAVLPDSISKPAEMYIFTIGLTTSAADEYDDIDSIDMKDSSA